MPPETSDALIIPIREQQDVLTARQKARTIASGLGLGIADQTRLATAISELTRNAILYAGGGECQLWDQSDDNTFRIRVEVRDQGPGIDDIALAMRDGYSTSGGLGAGLSGAKRLMDDFEIETSSAGTRVIVTLERSRQESFYI